MRYEDEGSTLVIHLASQQEGVQLNNIADYRKVVIDFRDVTLLSSAMIDQLILVNKMAKVHHADLRRRNVSPTVLEVLRITRLTKVFKKDDDSDSGDLDTAGVPVG